METRKGTERLVDRQHGPTPIPNLILPNRSPNLTSLRRNCCPRRARSGVVCLARQMRSGRKGGRGRPRCTRRGRPTLPVVRLLRTADHGGCEIATVHLASNDRTRQMVAVRHKLCSRTTTTSAREGGRGKETNVVLRVVPHHPSQNANEKSISSALTLPPPPINLPFGVAGPKQQYHHLRPSRLFPHLCRPHKQHRPLPLHLNDHLSLHARSRPLSHYLH